jgi:hypothetical protein
VVRCVYRGRLRWERVLANASNALMMLRAVGWGGCERVVGVWRGTSRGAAVRAGNEINSAGAASLAPSLSQMTQLTSLNLYGMLRVSRAAALGAVASNAGKCADDVA